MMAKATEVFNANKIVSTVFFLKHQYVWFQPVSCEKKKTFIDQDMNYKSYQYSKSNSNNQSINLLADLLAL